MHAAVVDVVNEAQVKELELRRRKGMRMLSRGAWMGSQECSFTTGGVFDISGGRATY